MGDYTSDATDNYTSSERTRSDEGEFSDFCTGICHYSGVHTGYLPLCTSRSASASNSNVLYDVISILRQLYTETYEDTE